MRRAPPAASRLGAVAQPANASNGASFGWAGAAGKLTETALSLDPVQMGARVYIASIGRFTSQDPIPGGNANAYTYSLDPINFSDLSGLSSGCGGGVGIACLTVGSGGLQGGGVGAAQLQSTASNYCGIVSILIVDWLRTEPQPLCVRAVRQRASLPAATLAAATIIASPPSFQDVVDFCDQKIIENAELDYKQVLPKDLTKHFAAMSNRYGGLIVVGVEEDSQTGKPSKSPRG